MTKTRTITFFNVTIICTILIFSCGDKNISLNQVNDREFISMSNIFYSDTSELKTCPRVEFSSLLFSIKHEKKFDLKKYKLLLHFNGYTVYNGPYQEEIKLLSKICAINSQSIIIYLYDDKEYFSWHKKSAYSLVDKNNSKVEINLLSKSNFSKSTGDEYKISFK